jgi:hypothetical protein
VTSCWVKASQITSIRSLLWLRGSSFYYWFLLTKKEKKECDISNELRHVTFLKSFDKC